MSFLKEVFLVLRLLTNSVYFNADVSFISSLIHSEFIFVCSVGQKSTHCMKEAADEMTYHRGGWSPWGMLLCQGLSSVSAIGWVGTTRGEEGWLILRGRDGIYLVAHSPGTYSACVPGGWLLRPAMPRSPALWHSSGDGRWQVWVGGQKMRWKRGRSIYSFYSLPV